VRLVVYNIEVTLHGLGSGIIQGQRCPCLLGGSLCEKVFCSGLLCMVGCISRLSVMIQEIV